MFDTLRALWFRVGRWPRLIAAATCLLLAALSALGSARDRAAARAPAPTVAVVVAARALAAGSVLRAADVRVERWPRSVHPPPTPGSVHAVVGRRCAGALVTDEPLTAARLLGAGIATGLPAGLGAVPVELAGDRAAEYVRAGDHVDVLAGPADTSDGEGDADGGSGADGNANGKAAGANHADLVAADATVLGVLPSSDGQSTVLVIAAGRDTALRVAREQASRTFTVMVNSP